MQHLWRRICPFATDSAGAIGIFANCDAHVLPCDPSGTAASYWRNDRRDPENFFVSRIPMSNSAFTLGNDEDFMAAYHRELEDSDPDFIVLVDTPLTAQVGVDLHRYAALLETEYERPVFAVSTTANQFYDNGARDALMALYDRCIPEKNREALLEERCQEGFYDDSVNLLGVSLLDFGDDAYIASLLDCAYAKNLDVLSTWGLQRRLSELDEAPFAERNIVASVSGLKLARAMERDFSIPYCTLEDSGLFDGIAEGIQIRYNAKFLVVGEQVTSNLVRSLIERMAAPGVDVSVQVATFYNLDAEISREGDMHWDDENDMERVMLNTAYDMVIADKALETLTPKGMRHLVYPLGHNATSGHCLVYDQHGNPLSWEWLKGIADAISRENKTSFTSMSPNEPRGAAGLRRPGRKPRMSKQQEG